MIGRFGGPSEEFRGPFKRKSDACSFISPYPFNAVKKSISHTPQEAPGAP